MSEEWLNFVQDPKTICKYGAKCYQKNPEHHKNYKHPPQTYQNKLKNVKCNHKRTEPYNKNKKPLVNESKEEDLVTIQNNSDTTAETKGDAKQDLKVSETDSEKIISKQKDSISILSKATAQFYDRTEDNKLYKELFLVEMPPDFFQFFKYLSGEEALEQILASVNLELIGPYDLLMGKLPILDDTELYLIHWRFFYNPPEFQVNDSIVPN